MNKKVYVTPRTDCVRVALEGSFASSVVQENPESGVNTSGHEIGEDIDVGNQEWNDGGWN